jgi:hypothetical protein
LELKERYSDSSDRSEFNPLWISVHANIWIEELKQRMLEELGLL